MIRQIVLTGGPCAGKTTALAQVSEALTERGWKVLTVPEVATMFSLAGLGDLASVAADPTKALGFQLSVLRTIHDLRLRFVELASLVDVGKTCLLMDRGEMDAQAYIGASAFTKVLAAAGLGIEEARDSYDAVIHLTTAADGAEDAYTLANNAARSESPELARQLDRATMLAWAGHEHFVVIDNRGDFTSKISRVIAAVCNALGDPESYEIERKFLLSKAPSPAQLAQADAIEVEIEQLYLQPSQVEPDAETRLRRRTESGVTVHTRTTKRRLGSGTRIERTEVITPEEFTELSTLADPARELVRKTRYVMLHGGQRWEIDHLVAPREIWLAEAELVSYDDELTPPDCVELGAEVTDDPAYSNANLAKP